MSPGAAYQEVALFGLAGSSRPRCPRCTEPLRLMDGEEILHRLEPLTKKYYARFRHCGRGDRIYRAVPSGHAGRSKFHPKG